MEGESNLNDLDHIRQSVKDGVTFVRITKKDSQRFVERTYEAVGPNKLLKIPISSAVVKVCENIWEIVALDTISVMQGRGYASAVVRSILFDANHNMAQEVRASIIKGGLFERYKTQYTKPEVLKKFYEDLGALVVEDATDNEYYRVSWELGGRF